MVNIDLFVSENKCDYFLFGPVCDRFDGQLPYLSYVSDSACRVFGQYIVFINSKYSALFSVHDVATVSVQVY